MNRIHSPFLFFFFNDTATTEIYTLSLHDALPISRDGNYVLLYDRYDIWQVSPDGSAAQNLTKAMGRKSRTSDRKSTRLNSSHLVISYAVFCLKKKKQINE